MLFTVIIISAISVITAGLVNATYKQLILSSLAKDSQIAFYQADTATECALYVDRVDTGLLESGGDFTCGNFLLKVIASGIDKDYQIEPDVIKEFVDPCFRIVVTKTSNGEKMDTKITAKGYNICNTDNPRTVERAIEINYSE